MATATTGVSRTQQVSHAVITAAMTVHTELGPGLLESTTLPACNMNWNELGSKQSLN